jgi:putative redox protein
MVKVQWQGRLAFEAEAPSGHRLLLDAYSEEDDPKTGPTPIEALLGSIGACSAMDVISVLEKKRQKVTSYRIEVDGERAPEGEWPRPFLSLTIRHILTGEDLDPVAVERAVELSDDKYCSVIATLRTSPEIRSEWQVESEPPGRAEATT